MSQKQVAHWHETFLFEVPSSEMLNESGNTGRRPQYSLERTGIDRFLIGTHCLPVTHV